MNEFESMIAAKKMSNEGRSHTEIMREIHKDESWIARSIRIMDRLPKEAIQWLKEGKISRTAAEKLSDMEVDKIKNIWKHAVQIYSKTKRN